MFPSSSIMWTRCPLLFWLCLVVVGVLGHDKDSSAETIFSEETIAISNTFDCTGKPDGYYTLQTEDCILYHKCETKSTMMGRRLRSTHMCPLGMKFQIRSMQCESWDQVQCEDAYRSFSKRQNNIRKPRSITRYPVVSSTNVNDIPQNCYWCCKSQPQPPRPENQWWIPQVTQRPQNIWQRPTVTPTTTTTTTDYWWYPSTTKRPNVWTRPTTFRPEVIEAKKDFNKKNRINNNYVKYSPASDVLLKFKLWKMTEKPKDDFIIIEDNYSPEIVEISRRHENRI